MIKWLLLLAALALATPAVAGRPPPPEVWNGAVAGMTIGQVLALFPSSHVPTLKRSLSGDVEGVEMTDVIADHPAIIGFYFGPHGLSAVVVEFADLEMGRQPRNLAEVRAFAELLSQKYGQPYRCAPNQVVDWFKCGWTLPAEHIQLDYRDGAPPTLAVTYRSPWNEARSGM
jgi:hypothetical protein